MKQKKKSWISRLLGSSRPDVAKYNRESPQIQKAEESKAALDAYKDRSLSNEARLDLLVKAAYPKRDLLVVPESMRNSVLLPEEIGVIFVDTPVPALVRT